MDEKIKYSLIIPVYNIEREMYLACLESCKKQKFKRVEFILIDDCSSYEHIQTISNEYCKIDNRFQYVRLECNSGVSVARNKGIELCSGEWILFLDADDYIASDYFVKIDEYLDNDYDLTIMGYREDIEGGKSMAVENEMVVGNEQFYDLQLSVLKGFDRCECKLPGDKLNPSTLVGKVFRNTIFKNIRLPIGIKKEQDCIVSLEIYNAVKSIRIIPYCGYFYKINQFSICRKYNPQIDSILLDTMAAYKETLIKLDIFKKDIKEAYYYKCISILGDICLLRYIHRDNPEPLRKRVAGFRKLLNNEEISKVLHGSSIYSLLKEKDFHNAIKLFLLKNKLIRVYFACFALSRKHHNHLYFK